MTVNVREFFESNMTFQFLSEKNRTFILDAIKQVEVEPTPFVAGSLARLIDDGRVTKEALLGILIGFAAADPRVKFRTSNQ